MSAFYDIVFQCDGCAAEVTVRPPRVLGVNPSQVKNTPPGWLWVRCRDMKHRVEGKHLAYVLACPSCAGDAALFTRSTDAWDEARRRYGKTLLDAFKESLGLWKDKNPPPPLCWPRAS